MSTTTSTNPQYTAVSTSDPMTAAMLGHEYDTRLNFAFFLASLCILLSGALGILEFFFLFLIEPFTFVDQFFLFVFGVVFFTLDAPLNFKWILDVKNGVRKFFRVLTTLTGKGMILIFMSCIVFTTLWDERISKTLALIMSTTVFLVGVISLLIGVTLSSKLQNVRAALQEQNPDRKAMEVYLKQFTVQYPSQGLAKTEFITMASAVTRETIDNKDISLFYSAIAADATVTKNLLTIEEILEWTEPGIRVFV